MRTRRGIAVDRAEGAQIIASQVGLVIAVLILWWWVGEQGLVSPLLLPKPGAALAALPELLADPQTWWHLRLTGLEIAAAFAISTLAGVSIGFWTGTSEYRSRLVEPFLVSAYMVPIVLLYPIVLLVFGVGPSSKIVFAGVYGFFPVALNTMRAFRSVDGKLITAAISMGATAGQRIRHVLLPAARPLIVSGVRVGAALNLTGVIVGEMLASRAGLGYEIARTSQTFSVPKLYAYIFIALVMIILFNRVVARQE